MKQKNIQQIMDMIGVKQIFEFSHGKLQGSTKIATNGKEYLTVSQLLDRTAYVLKFIKTNFDVNKYDYSVTISFLKTLQLVLNNGRGKKPDKEEAHIIIDVFLEIADMHTQDEEQRERNAEIANAISCLIEILR